MNKRSQKALLMSFIMVFVLAVMAGIVYLGSRITGSMALLVSELVLCFIVIPRVVVLYYKLYDMRPNMFMCFVPIFNTTMLMSSGMTKIVLGSTILSIISGLLARFNGMFSGLAINVYLNVVDYLKYGFFISMLLVLIFTGIGLVRVFSKINELYSLAFDNSEIQYGHYKVLSGLISTSYILTSLMFMVPVIRILPCILMLDKLSDLTTGGVRFMDYEEPYEEFEELEYEDIRE